MPHNLYLHSLGANQKILERTTAESSFEIQFHRFYHCIKLGFSSERILILAAATFYRNGMFEVAEIQDAHRFLEPLLGSKFAPIFAVALIAAGQSSTITGTLADKL
jgi:manganese transport protein